MFVNTDIELEMMHTLKWGCIIGNAKREFRQFDAD